MNVLIALAVAFFAVHSCYLAIILLVLIIGLIAESQMSTQQYITRWESKSQSAWYGPARYTV